MDVVLPDFIDNVYKLLLFDEDSPLPPHSRNHMIQLFEKLKNLSCLPPE